MRYTATEAHSKLQTAASKYLQFRVYYRVVTVFNTDIDTGTWVELTSRVTTLPDITTRLEYNLGQFVTDSLAITARGIEYFKGVFTLSAGQYVEVKVTGQIGYAAGSLEATTVNLFAGFVDIPTLTYDEEKDEAKFTAYCLDDFTGRITAENLTTRYVVQNITGTTEGLYLPQIPGLYVTNANVASYVLQLGTHTLDFRYSSPNYQARLDGGAWTNLTANAETTLTSESGTQKITVYAKSLYWLQAEATDYVIVKNAGDTLPYTWYSYMWVEKILKTGFDLAGARAYSLDSFQMPTFDSRRGLSYLDIPPGDPSIEGYRFAVCGDNLASNLLYVGVKGNLYSFNTVTHVWTLLATVDSGADTFIFDIQLGQGSEVTSYLLIFYIVSGASYVKRCTLTGSGLTAAINTGITLHGQSAKVIYFEYDTPDYIYHIIAVDDSNNRIIRIDINTWALTSLFTFAGLGYTSGYLAGPLLARPNTGEVWFLVRENAAITYGVYFHNLYWEGASLAWIDNGSIYEIDGGGSDLEPYQLGAALDTSRGYWYYWDYIDSTLKRLSVTASTETTIASSVTVVALYYNPGEAVTYYVLNNGKIYSVATTSPTYLDEAVEIATGPMAFMSSLGGNSSATYGLDGKGLLNGRLFKLGATLEMYVEYADYVDMTVKEALVEVLNAFNLVYNVRPDKTVLVYRRGNASGTPVTTGDTLTGSTTTASQIAQEASEYLAVGLVTVANANKSTNYNGTSFDVTVLADTRRLSVTNRYSPDKLLKDLAYYIYQYYKTTKRAYRVYFDGIPYWQYEPLDGMSIGLGSTKIGATGSGVITEARHSPQGNSIFRVIL